jgi:hypothetical protein
LRASESFIAATMADSPGAERRAGAVSAAATQANAKSFMVWQGTRQEDDWPPAKFRESAFQRTADCPSAQVSA